MPFEELPTLGPVIHICQTRQGDFAAACAEVIVYNKSIYADFMTAVANDQYAVVKIAGPDKDLFCAFFPCLTKVVVPSEMCYELIDPDNMTRYYTTFDNALKLAQGILLELGKHPSPDFSEGAIDTETLKVYETNGMVPSDKEEQVRLLNNCYGDQ